MAAITKTLLETAKANLLSQREQVMGALNKIEGALEVINEQLGEIDKPEPQK